MPHCGRGVRAVDENGAGAILPPPFPMVRSNARHPSQGQASGTLFNSSAGNLCGDSRRAEEASDRVTKCPASSWAFGSAQSLQAHKLKVKSLILAQIERWRRA